MEKIYIPEKRLASLLNITPRYARQIFENYKVDKGFYDLIPCIKLYLKQRDSNYEDIKAQTAKFKLDVLKKNYIPVDEVEILLGEITSMTKSKVRAIPSKASRLLEGETERLKIEAILKTFTDEILNSLSEYKEMEWEETHDEKD